MAYTLITGASSGIGEQFARDLAAKKTNLILVARSKDKLNELAEQFRKDHGIDVQVIAQDLSRPEGPDEVLKACQERHLDVDTLINNAGVLNNKPFEKMDAASILDLVMVNIYALTKLTYLFLPELKKCKGRIMNVASVAGFQPIPFMNVYSATKAYVLSFSEALAEELNGTGVSVTIFAPGVVETPGVIRTTRGEEPVNFRLPITTTDKVSEPALKGLENRDEWVIPGFLNNFVIFTNRLTPRKLVVKATRFMMGH